MAVVVSAVFVVVVVIFVVGTVVVSAVFVGIVSAVRAVVGVVGVVPVVAGLVAEGIQKYSLRNSTATATTVTARKNAQKAPARSRSLRGIFSLASLARIVARGGD
ncbi:hypothetical protein [Halorussus caseinilyticus]|uniref:Secreted peptide n=1 Tax=Halorussus caseinilyticus TaxID=3034025 RepID=A0ABD5WNZ7_9EURY|nr:hypothetical protein [Halorussus sp. DT72]